MLGLLYLLAKTRMNVNKKNWLDQRDCFYSVKHKSLDKKDDSG